MSKTKASIAGSALAHARARKLTPERRAEIAREAGKASGRSRAKTSDASRPESDTTEK